MSIQPSTAPAGKTPLNEGVWGESPWRTMPVRPRRLGQRSRLRRPLGRISLRPPQSGGAVFHAETLRFFSAKHCSAVPSESVVPLFHVVERQEAAPCFSSRGTGGFRQGTILCGSGCFSCETGKLCQETVRRGSATVSPPPPAFRLSTKC